MKVDIQEIINDLKIIAAKAMTADNLMAAIAAKKAIADIVIKNSKLQTDSGVDIENLSLSEIEELCSKIEQYLKNNENNEKLNKLEKKQIKN